MTEYWYAWRGGPQILRIGPLKAAEMGRAIAAALPEATATYKAKIGSPADRATLYGLITRYLRPEDDEPTLPPQHLRSMAPRTLQDRRKHLDFIRSDRTMADLEIAALKAPGIREDLLDWRDTMASTPKTADERLYALSCVLDWAKRRRELAVNPVAEFERLYEPPDRSEIIWEPKHLAIAYRHADKPFADFVSVAVMSGPRNGDLRSIPKTAVGEDVITFQTGKSRKRRTVVIPIIDELRPVLAGITDRPDSLTLLNSSRGRPWSEAGIESALRRVKEAALKEARERHGPDAKSGIEHLRIHDMRGTAATNFMIYGMDDEQIATIMGWKLERVREIRRRYVGAEALGRAMLDRIRENRARAASVKAGVKPV